LILNTIFASAAIVNNYTNFSRDSQKNVRYIIFTFRTQAAFF